MVDLRKVMADAGIEISDEEQESSINHPHKFPVVKIKLNHHSGGAIWINDFLLPYTTRVTFDAGVEGIPKVHIEMYAAIHVEAEAEVDITCTDITAKVKP